MERKRKRKREREREWRERKTGKRSHFIQYTITPNDFIVGLEFTWGSMSSPVSIVRDYIH